MTTNPNTTLALPNTNDAARTAMLNAAGGLGALVWWSLTDTRITPDRLRGILSAEGDDPSRVPDIEQGAAVRRATRSWAQGRGNADRFRAEVAQEQGAVLTIGILRRTKPAADEVRWVQVDQVAFDSASGAWTATGTTAEAAAFRAEADEARTHLDHDWIRPQILLRGLTQAQSVCLRDRGGVYYVPAQHQDELARLARIVAKIGRCHLDIVHAQATPESRSSIASGASASLRDNLGALVERIHGWAESARKVSDSSADTVLSDLADLKAKADLYADALQVSMDDLTTAIDSAKAEAERILTGVAVAPTARIKVVRPAPDAIVNALKQAIALGEHLPDGSVMIAANVLQACGLKCNADRPPREGVLSSGNAGYWTNAIGSRAAAMLGFSARLRGAALDAPLQLRPLAFVSKAVALAAAPTEAPIAPDAGTPSSDAQEPVATAQEQEVAPEPTPTPEPVVELDPEPETTVVPVDEEASEDLREKLAGMTPSEVRAVFERSFGPAGSRSKAQMISRIVNAAS